MNAPIRILIADDHPLFRSGLRALLDSVADTEVVGEAATGEEAVEIALALTPDVVVMDINMPGLNGIDATRDILDESGDINILVMTMHDDDDAVFADAVFLHFDRAQLDGVLRKAARAAPVLAFATREGKGEEWSNRHLDLPRHFVLWQEAPLRDLLAATGWSVRRLERGDSRIGTWLQILAVRA